MVLWWSQGVVVENTEAAIAEIEVINGGVNWRREQGIELVILGGFEIDWLVHLN